MSPVPARTHFYLAASSGRAELAKTIMGDLENRGFVNAHDWPNSLLPKNATHDEIRRAADGCKDGVRRCDVLILMLPIGRGGAFVEQGIALGMGKPVIVVSPDESLVYEFPMVFLFTSGVERFTGTRAWQDTYEWLDTFHERLGNDREQDSRMVWG